MLVDHSFLLTYGKFQAQEKEAADVPEDENASNAQANAETSSKEEIFNPPVFVNTRRGKVNGTKRKISDTSMANECDVHGPPAYAEVLDVCVCEFVFPCVDFTIPAAATSRNEGMTVFLRGTLRMPCPQHPVVPGVGKKEKCPQPRTKNLCPLA